MPKAGEPSKKHRSPAYPSMDLKEAIEKIRVVYRHEKRHAVPVGVVVAHFDYADDMKSSSALRLIAALKQFGLVAETGSGDDRKVRVSDLALDILLADDESSPKRLEAIKKAALLPEAYKKAWDHFGGNLPSDATLRSYFIRELDFNDTVVGYCIKRLRSTIDFAGLSAGDKILESNEGGADGDSGVKPKFPESMFSDAASTFADAIFRPHREQKMQATHPQQETRREVFTLAEGDVLVQWPANLSPSSVEDLEDHLNLILRKVKRSINDDRSGGESK